MATWALVGRELRPIAEAKRGEGWDGRVIVGLPEDERAANDALKKADTILTRWLDPSRPTRRDDPVVAMVSALSDLWDPVDVQALTSARELAELCCTYAPYRPSAALVRNVARAFETPLGAALGLEILAFAAAAAPLVNVDRVASLVRHCTTAECAFAPATSPRLAQSLRRVLTPFPEARRERLLRDLWDRAHPTDRHHHESAGADPTRWRRPETLLVAEMATIGWIRLPDGFVEHWVGLDDRERAEWLRCLSPDARHRLIDALPDDTRFGTHTILQMTDAEIGRAIRRGLMPDSLAAATRERGPDVDIALMMGFWIGESAPPDPPGAYPDPAAVGRMLGARHRARRRALIHRHPSTAVVALAAAGEAIDPGLLAHPGISLPAAVIAASSLPRPAVLAIVRNLTDFNRKVALISAAPRVDADGGPWIPRDLLEETYGQLAPDDVRHPWVTAALATHLLPSDEAAVRRRWGQRLRSASRAMSKRNGQPYSAEERALITTFELPTHYTGHGIDGILESANRAVRLDWWRDGVLPEGDLVHDDILDARLRPYEAIRLGSFARGDVTRQAIAELIDLPASLRPVSPIATLVGDAVKHLDHLGAVPTRPKTWLDLTEPPQTDPYDYPPEIAELDGLVLDAAWSWTIRLPASPADLDRNGRWMGNCTFTYYEEDVAAGKMVILVIHGPDDQRWNAELALQRGRWMLGEVNSRWNRREVPPALHRLLSELTRQLNDPDAADSEPTHAEIGPPPRVRPPFRVRARARRTRHRRPA